MKLMGHDSLEIVLQYCHVSEDDLFDAVASVRFEAMLKPETNETQRDPVRSDERSGGGEKQAEN
jgi:hypothetical protein